MCQKKKKKKKKKKKNYARAIKPNPQNMGILTRKLDPQKNPAENQLVPLKRVELSKNKKNKKKFNNQHPSPGWKPRPRLSVDYTELKVFFFFFILLGRVCTCTCVSRLVNCRLAQFPHNECSTTQTYFFSNFLFFLSFVCFGSQLTNYFFCVLLPLPTSRVPNLS
jgi:hypothetical protein